MEFRYSTEQDDFRASLSGFLRDAAPLAAVREAAGHDPQLWQRLCSELELPGLHIPLEYGGAGGTLVETAIVFSELGRALTPVPLAATTFAIEAVFRTGDEEQRRRLLKGMLCGEQVGALAVAGPDDTDPSTARVRADWHGRHGTHRRVRSRSARSRRGPVHRARGRRRCGHPPRCGGRRPRSDCREPALVRHHPAGRQAGAGAGARRSTGRRFARRVERVHGRRAGAAGRRDARRRRGVSRHGGGIRLHPKAIRPADRLVSGGEARLRRDDDRDRCDPRGGDVRRDERCERRRTTDRRSAGEGAGRRHLHPVRRVRRSRCTAVSPSRGSTTCTCTSGGPRQPRRSSAEARTTVGLLADRAGL